MAEPAACIGKANPATGHRRAERDRRRTAPTFRIGLDERGSRPQWALRESATHGCGNLYMAHDSCEPILVPSNIHVTSRRVKPRTRRLAQGC